MPRRIEDCISDLGVSACRNAVAQQTPIRHSRQGHIAKMWAHAREIAQYSKQVSHEMPRVNPEEAYLVGLLHLLASLPVVLGWEISGEVDVNDPLNGWQLAKRWSLPHSLFEYFSEIIIPGCETRWLQIVRSAHQRASWSGVNCPFELDLRPGPVAGK
jgi:HD-like signal output (HDOD) protein